MKTTVTTLQNMKAENKKQMLDELKGENNE